MNVGILLPQKILTVSTRITISKLIEECNNEPDIDKKIQLFYRVNSMLPSSYQVSIPSLITDDYIDTTLYRIHQNMQIANAVGDSKTLSDEFKINVSSHANIMSCDKPCTVSNTYCESVLGA
jgi:predicted DNA-binding protein (UPF0278 family)